MICRMSFDDFKRNFTDIEICNITLDQFDEDQSSKCCVIITRVTVTKERLKDRYIITMN